MNEEENKQNWSRLNLIVLGYLVICCFIGIFFKQITFGWGLADLLGYGMLIGGTIIHLVCTLLVKSRSKKMFLAIISLCFAIYMSLLATLWRGNEYSWNGSVFYLPCPHNIEIYKEGVKEEKLVPMCTMEYYSVFSGIWNGEELKSVDGDIKIPKELKPYITCPITDIVLEPRTYLYRPKTETDLVRKKDFELDSLELGREYIFAGEITKIRNGKPTFKVKLKSK